MKKSIIWGIVASILGATLATLISLLWSNLFILLLISGCVVGFAVRLTGNKGEYRLAIIGAICSAISCLLALYLICLVHNVDFILTIQDGAWISMLISIVIGAYQSKNNEIIDSSNP